MEVHSKSATEDLLISEKLTDPAPCRQTEHLYTISLLLLLAHESLGVRRIR